LQSKTEKPQKTLDQCFDNAEQKLSRGKNRNVDSLYPILRMIAKEGFKEWLEQKDIERTYLTKDELEMSIEEVNLQVVLGLQSCKTKNDVCGLLNDLRQHERHVLLKELML
jgi:hypothetical protein